jgi:hypothetical protein
MSDVKIEPGQVWRFRDEREDRNVVVDSVDRLSDGTTFWVQTRNEATGRRSLLRAGTLVRYYRLQVRDA